MQAGVWSRPPLLAIVRHAPNIGFVEAGRHVAEKQRHNVSLSLSGVEGYPPGDGDKLRSGQHLRVSTPLPCRRQAPLGTCFAPAAATNPHFAVTQSDSTSARTI